MNKPEWKRPRTTKIYLHPPVAERLCLLTPDMKMIDASLIPNSSHMNQPSVGLVLLTGAEMQPFDCRDVRFDPVSSGVPIYTVRNQTENLNVSMEAFCNMERIPTTYFRVTVQNVGAERVEDCLGLLPRSGVDGYLTCQHHEGYGLYATNINVWYMLKRTWKREGETTETDGKAGVRLQLPDTLQYRFVSDPEDCHMFSPADFFKVEYALAPGESLQFEGALCSHGIPEPFVYEEEKKQTEAAWKEILAPIGVVPNTDAPEVQNAYRHLAMQLCQMLARYEGSAYVTPRQGDLGRNVWPFEATIFLHVLDKIGLRTYTADAYRYLIDQKMQQDGVDAGRIGGANGWENYTGATIWGLSQHLKYANSQAEMDEFLPSLMNMLRWIERKRRIPSEGYAGIFPAGRGSDWADVAQFWTLTDCYNAMGERSLAEVLEMYGRPEAREAREAYESYAETLIKIRDELYAGHENDEMYILPHELGIPFEDTEQYSYYCDGAPIMLLTEFMDPKSRMREQMEMFFRKRGQFDHGMTGRMTNCNLGYDTGYFIGYGDVWYTQHSEYYWIKGWTAAGEWEKAQETLDASMRYGMTEEFVVSERYCSSEPFYNPWQPNASGSARLMESMLKVYGERTV